MHSTFESVLVKGELTESNN